jgi:hypothetical protein
MGNKFMKKKFRPVIISTFAPPALACIRSWGRQGWEPGMICICSASDGKPASRYLCSWEKLTPEKIYTDEGIQIICDFLKKFHADGIIAINEKVSCWLNDNRHKIPEDATVWLPENQVFKEILSKKKQAEVAKNAGMDVLPTHLLHQQTRVEHIESSHFPLCLRPASPGSLLPSFKVRIVHSPKQLKAFLQNFHEIKDPIIAQPFLSFPNLVIHGTRTLSGEHIGMRAFLVERKFEGVTLSIRPFRNSHALLRKCEDFTDRFRLVGNYHFEFLYDPDTLKAWFLEINNRFGGTTAKVYFCGYDEPVLALQAFGIKNVKTVAVTKNVTVSGKTALMKYMIYAIRRRLTELDFPNESVLRRIYSSICALVFYKDDVFCRHDIKGSLAMYFANIIAKIR